MSVKVQNICQEQPAPAGGVVVTNVFVVTSVNQLLMVSGSAWANAAASLITVQVYVNGPAGQVMNAVMNLYSNPAGTHAALPTLMVPLTLTNAGGPYTVQISAGSGTTIDQNDYYSVVLVELDAGGMPVP